MYKESLFEKIRSEDVIIWAGAGLSISSGYPSGNKLKDIFYNSLTQAEKNMMSSDLSLQELTEAIVTVKGNRHHIISTLNEVFGQQPPTPSDVHNKISLIPHFNTIVTTNYDKLFEQSCNSHVLVYNENQIPYLDKAGKTKIIKVHGDLALPDSVVITKSDYNRLFTSNNLNNTLWGQIKAKLSTKTFLFLGYSAEDPNFQVILDEISNSLGANRKEFFFIAPNISELKKIELTKRNIHYINSTGEEFIDELIVNIKENITDDLQKGKVSADTFRIFMSHHNLNPLISSQGNSFQINDIQCLAPTEVKTELKIIDRDVAKAFSSYINSNSSKDFILEKSAMKEINMWYGGIKLDLSSEIVNVKITAIPTKSGFIDIIFEDDFEANVYSELYRNNFGFEIKLKFTGGDIIVNVTIEQSGHRVKIDIIPNKICGDIASSIIFYGFLTRVNSKRKFTVILEDGQKFSQSLSSIELPPDFEAYLRYFESLKNIERFFKVKFKNFNHNEIGNESERNLNKLIAITNKEEFDTKFTGDFSATVKNTGSLETNSELQGVINEKVIRITYKDEEKLELHGIKFDLSRKYIIINDAFYPNSQEVLDAGSEKMIIKSKSNTAKIIYNTESINEME